ncbi:MAG: hypothetical protein LRY55_16135 [Leadbetterella sp.]|nr:hypothetical protein [Leadbetterella sp.]
MNRLPFLLIVAFFFGLTSCKMEGPAGKDGADGNANVKTQLITVSSADWAGDSFMYGAQKPSAIITSEIVNSGVVLCYMQTGNNLFTAMPFTFTLEEEVAAGSYNLYDSHAFYEYGPEVIYFYLQDNDARTARPSGNITFKVVAIASSEVVANLDTRNYNEVAKALKLND